MTFNNNNNNNNNDDDHNNNNNDTTTTNNNNTFWNLLIFQTSIVTGTPIVCHFDTNSWCNHS